ncbi:hypothetical protein AQAU111925_10160 [Aquirufa aurantiipilula]
MDISKVIIKRLPRKYNEQAKFLELGFDRDQPSHISVFFYEYFACQEIGRPQSNSHIENQ